MYKNKKTKKNFKMNKKKKTNQTNLKIILNKKKQKRI